MPEPSPTPPKRAMQPSEAAQLADAVTRLRRALRKAGRRSFPHEALPVGQVELLQCLADLPEARVGHVAELLRLAPNSVTTLANQLSDRSLVDRRPIPGDRRAVVLRLTGAGRRELERWQQAQEQMLDAALSGLDEADQRALVAALPALRHLAERLQ